VNIFQERLLEHVAVFAARFQCLSAIYVYGGVARGETATADDVDLAADFLPEEVMARECGESYGQFQWAFEDWALASRDLFGRTFRFSRAFIGETGGEWSAVKAAAENPVAVIGKAVLAATPRHKTKP